MKVDLSERIIEIESEEEREALLDMLRPRGEWLHKEINGHFHVYGQCSKCKQRKRVDNFCGNCGAYMRKEDEHGS